MSGMYPNEPPDDKVVPCDTCLKTGSVCSICAFAHIECDCGDDQPGPDTKEDCADCKGTGEQVIKI